MAKIACITSGLTGIVLASYAIVDRLQTEGHEVISASPYLGGARIQEIGAPYMQLLPATERPEKKEFIPFRSESKLHRFFFSLEIC